ncbi:hypothetical protein HKX48_005857 [Thoreauomyces humboldtii]|nr:hypothetical protein HKX48_005857 [Thoreauomyces humboldtii]
MSVYLEQAPRKEQLRVAQILRDPTYLTTPSNSFLPRNSSPSPTVHPEHPTSVKEPAAASSLKLKREEEQIDLKVLHHLNKDDSRKKQKRFKRTVLAVHRIVTHKLYRTKARSLEAYFRDAWKISRAQVYRFLDCAVILKQLDDFTEQPCRERLCRSLKRVAKNHADLNKLWESVLLKVNDDHEAVTSTIINAVWAELLESGLVTGDPPEREELLDDEPPSATAALAELESQFAQDGELDCRTNSPVQDSHLDSQQSSQAELFSQSERQHTQTSRSYDPAAGGEVVSSNNVVKPAYAEETPVYRPANVVHPLSTGNVYQATSGPSSPSDFAYPPTLESHGLQRKLSDMDGMRTRASTIPDATACIMDLLYNH